MSKRKRVLIWFSALLGVLALYLYFFGPQTAFALMAWNTGRKMPSAKVVPVELNDVSINHAPGTTLSYFGYAFEIPWKGIDAAKSKTIGTIQLITLQSHMAILVSSIPPRAFVASVAKMAGGDKILEREYGDFMVSSDYNFQRAMLNTTPRTVSPFGSRAADVRGSMLLLMKAISMPSQGSSGIFSVKNQYFRGFQYGDPRTSTGKFSVDLFDDEGGVEFILTCNGLCTAPAITQADINRISQSLVRASPAPVGPAAKPAVADFQVSR
jgi:hypothetical protein